MSNYSTEIKEYIESFSHYNQHDFPLSHAEKIEIGRTKLFDFDYPIFDVNYKKVFEKHFIRKFYMREIGFETMGLFKFQLETWLIINMPYFNKLFESELIKYDPLKNSDMNVTHTKKNDKTQNDDRDVTQNANVDGTTNTSNIKDSNGSLTEDNFDRQLESNNPDSRLSLTSNDGEGVIQYASSINENNENNSKTSISHEDVTTENTSNVKSDTTQNDKLISNINETEDYVQSRVGKVGGQSYSKMMSEYRNSLIRIENTIFEEMQELFMLVY
jgi:hypothetical protein